MFGDDRVYDTRNHFRMLFPVGHDWREKEMRAIRKPVEPEELSKGWLAFVDTTFVVKIVRLW
jgi:hypothetical protein